MVSERIDVFKKFSWPLIKYMEITIWKWLQNFPNIIKTANGQFYFISRLLNVLWYWTYTNLSEHKYFPGTQILYFN